MPDISQKAQTAKAAIDRQLHDTKNFAQYPPISTPKPKPIPVANHVSESLWHQFSAETNARLEKAYADSPRAVQLAKRLAFQAFNFPGDISNESDLNKAVHQIVMDGGLVPQKAQGHNYFGSFHFEPQYNMLPLWACYLDTALNILKEVNEVDGLEKTHAE